jgi:hypothetical protein
MRTLAGVLVTILSATALQSATAQVERPTPYPVVPTLDYQRAIAAGTRSATGAPGPNYWQQWTDYRLRGSLDPQTKTVRGTAHIRYHNRSPHTLDTLKVHLHQNLHAPGVERNRIQEVTGGMQLERVVVQGAQLGRDTSAASYYRVENTIMTIVPPSAVRSGQTAELQIAWRFTVPQSGASRMGWSEDNLFFIAYWYPQMAVYDDIVGWHVDPYRGDAEFTVGFGNYDVEIEAPVGWVIRATGTLRNPDEVLPPAIQQRLAAAARGDTVVHVLTQQDFGPGRATRAAPAGRLTWHFTADSVRDAVFSATRASLWDATRTPVGDRDGDGRLDYTLIESLWRPNATRWAHEWRYAQHSIAFLSQFTGLAYPWPHMTSVEGGGIRGGGMEYPMMTLMGDYIGRSDTSLYSVTAHELAHMWVPMQIANDEKRHAWIDEGTTSFNDIQAQRDFYPGSPAMESDRDRYLERARAGTEGELMRWTEYQYPGRSGVASYQKPATLLGMLRALLGDDVFLPAYRGFLSNWRYKHPQPWDLFNSFNHAAGHDLSWFWRTWYYETWTLDHAVREVRDDDAPVIVVEDRGSAPMPARLTITLADGSIAFREVPVERWLQGKRTAEVTLPRGTRVMRVEIDADQVFPDIDRSNDVWVRIGH